MRRNVKKMVISTAIMSLLAQLAINSFAAEGPVMNDAYISMTKPTKNFGGDADLVVDNNHNSYIRIDLSTLPPGTTGSQISHATLRLWVSKVNADGIIEVSPATSGWNENTLTGNSAPSAGERVTKVEVSPGTVNQYIVIDLTELVKIWADYPAQNFGVVLHTSSGAAVSFESKEAVGSHGGLLDVTLQSIGQKGDKGDTGATGPQGMPGVKGDKGDIGATGTQGIPGVKGDKGDIGATGTQGLPGVKGDIGAAGAQGIPGVKGDKGDIGATGPQGLPGVKGDKGDIGATGTQGLPGAKGDQGDIGAAGAQGLPGVKGDKGDTGLQGTPGLKGDKGDTGAIGATGTHGIPGVKGDKGDMGMQGIPGLKGDKGDPGADGALTAWSRKGNAGTIDGVNFIGTTDNVPFNIRVNSRKAGQVNSDVSANTFYGYLAGENNTVGRQNTASGVYALQKNTAGSDNVAYGSQTLSANISGSSNVALGLAALRENTTGSGNIAIGFALAKNTTGVGNVAIGNSTNITNLTGSFNVAVGNNAFSGGDNNLTASTAIGASALISGNRATAIGADATAYANNSTAIGAGAVAGQANSIRLGNTTITVIQGQVGFTAASDSRLKENIQPLEAGSSFIMKLQPVSYRMKNPADPRRNWGFIAQDIESLLGTDNAILTVGGDTDRTLGLRYTDFIAPMVKTIQEQQAVIKALEQENKELRKQMESEDSQIKSRLANLKAEFDQLLKKIGGKLNNSPNR